MSNAVKKETTDGVSLETRFGVSRKLKLFFVVVPVVFLRLAGNEASCLMPSVPTHFVHQTILRRCGLLFYV